MQNGKRGLPPDLCTNKGKFENRLSACDAQVGRFSFYNLDEPVRYLSPFWFWLVQVGFLIRLLEMKKKEEVLSILENVYPGRLIEPKVMYVLEGIFDEL